MCLRACTVKVRREQGGSDGLNIDDTCSLHSDALSAWRGHVRDACPIRNEYMSSCDALVQWLRRMQPNHF